MASYFGSSPIAPVLLCPRLKTACVAIRAVARAACQRVPRISILHKPLRLLRSYLARSGTRGIQRGYQQPELNCAVGQHGERLISAMCRTEVAFGAAVARRFGRVAFWLAWVLDGATWGLGALRLANCRAEAESPPPASTGGGPGRKGCLMLLVDSVPGSLNDEL